MKKLVLAAGLLAPLAAVPALAQDANSGFVATQDRIPQAAAPVREFIARPSLGGSGHVGIRFQNRAPAASQEVPSSAFNPGN